MSKHNIHLVPGYEDLGQCVTCHCVEGTLPSECPGEPVHPKTQDAVFRGRLDYKGGQWVHLNPPSEEDGS